MPGVENKDKPSSKVVRDFHINADTDGSQKGLHHTLGPGANQAAPGNHTHDGGNSATLPLPLEGVTITGVTEADQIDSIILALVKLGATDGT